MKQRVLFGLAGIICLIWACSESKKDADQVVAVFDGREITLDEFREFYELDPNFGIDSNGIDALRDELLFYIGQMRALKKAKSEDLLSDPVFKRAIEWEERQAMLRQLFRDEVLDKVSVTEKEMAEFFIKQNAMIHVRHLFVPDEDQINYLKERLENGDSFENLAADIYRDSILAANGGDLGWIRLSELDDDFAKAVAALGANQVSEPFRTKWGYHIVELLDRKEQVVLIENEFLSKKKSLDKKIRQVKSQELSRKLVSEYMAGLNPQPSESAFRLLWQAVVPAGEQENAQLSARQMLSNPLIEAARKRLAGKLQIALITYRTGQVTISEFLDAMEKIPSGQRPRFKSQRGLSNRMAVWMRDEMLFDEARKKDLHKHKDVISEVQRFSEEQSYYFYMNQILDQLQVPSEISEYFSNQAQGESVWQKDLMRFHTLQEWKWEQARILLWKSLQNDEQDVQINEEMLHRENAEIDWGRRIRMFMVRKPE